MAGIDLEYLCLPVMFKRPGMAQAGKAELICLPASRQTVKCLMSHVSCLISSTTTPPPPPIERLEAKSIINENFLINP